MKRTVKEEDTISKEKRGNFPKKDEQGKDQCGLSHKPKQMVGTRARGFYRELRMPENLKRLVVSVILVLSIGLYTTYMFKSFARDDNEL